MRFLVQILFFPILVILLPKMFPFLVCLLCAYRKQECMFWAQGVINVPSQPTCNHIRHIKTNDMSLTFLPARSSTTWRDKDDHQSHYSFIWCSWRIRGKGLIRWKGAINKHHSPSLLFLCFNFLPGSDRFASTMTWQLQISHLQTNANGSLNTF